MSRLCCGICGHRSTVSMATCPRCNARITAGFAGVAVVAISAPIVLCAFAYHLFAGIAALIAACWLLNKTPVGWISQEQHAKEKAARAKAIAERAEANKIRHPLPSNPFKL